jgi:hypothetical protein
MTAQAYDRIFDLEAQAQSVLIRPKEPLPMSSETEARLKAVAERFQGREMFPEAIARAKAMLVGLRDEDWPHNKYPELFR